jgi:Ran GTPase-activating protein (RanGAP) involved in mRNA processing and transport
MQEVSRVMELASFTCDNKEFIMLGINIWPAESTALFEFLSYIKNLNKLVIRECYMEHFAFRELAKLLIIRDNDINCKLTELNIRHNTLTDEGAKYLSDALKSGNCELTQLDISYNKLTDEGAKYLSDALKSGNCKLTH